MGEAGYVPAGYAMISAYFPEEKRSTMNGIWNAAYPLGAALGIVLGGVIAEKYGWRHAFGIVAIPGLVVALLFLRVRDYRTVDLVAAGSAAGGRAELRMKAPDIVRTILSTPLLLFTYFGYAGNMFFTVGLITWLPTYYNRIDGLSMDKAGPKASVIMLLAMVGGPLGGFLTDRLRKKRLSARMGFPAFSSFLTALLMFVAFQFFSGTAQYGVIIAVGLCAALFIPGASAVTQDVVHPGLRAISYSVAVIVQSLLGSSLGPIFIGMVSDRFDLITAFKLLPLFAVLSGALFLAGFFLRARHKKGG